MAEQPIEWRSDIELLLGQNVVRNWLSSSDVDDVAKNGCSMGRQFLVLGLRQSPSDRL